MAEGEAPGDYISKRVDLHDCFFVVGENEERISTVKYFLANYSPYFRAMLLETDMKEKNSKKDIVISDSEPDVFKLMLSYVYGCQNITFENVDQAMRFHMLVDKCLMTKLKELSIKYLLENCTNPCDVLNCFVLLEIKELEPRALQILHGETQQLLSSSDFMNVSPAIIEFIVKQQRLNVTEGFLWRALVQWATHQCGGKQEGSDFRKKVRIFIKHVKFFKMSLKEFALDVVPLNILTSSEVINIFVNNATRKDDILKEAPPKTRQEWSQACVATFTSNRCLQSSVISFEHHYMIHNTGLENLEITLIEFSSSINSLYLTNNLLKLRLYSTSENSILKMSSDVLLEYKNGKYIMPNVLLLSGGWVVESSKQYNLTIRHNMKTDPKIKGSLSASVNPNICTVQCYGDKGSSYHYDNYYGSHHIISVVQSIKFSFQPESLN